MRKQILRATAALGILFGVTSLASAQALPGSGWYSTAVIQNVGSAAATVHLDVYAQNSTAAPATADISPQIAPGASRVFFPGSGSQFGNVDVSSPLPGNFSGSMVVSSDQPVVAIGQITNFQNTGFGVGVAGGYASEQYRGSPANSATINFPLVKSSFGGKTTIFTVQAAGADVTATATILTSDGVSHSKPLDIKANRSVTFGPSDGFTPAVATTGCGNDPNTSVCFGSLTVAATGNIAGVALEYQDGVSPATAVQAASMFGTEDVGDTVLCPIIKNDFAGNHRTTGTSVANTGAAPVTVNATFSTAGGTTFTQPAVTIQAGKSFVFSAFQSTIGGMPAGTLASAKITADKPTIVGVVSERNISGSPVKFTTYTCFNPANATAKIAAPVVKRDFGNNTTGIQVQNANATGNVTVSATYTCNSGANTYGPVVTTSLAPGGGFTFFQPAAVPAGNLCAVTLDAGGANKIVAVVNESSDGFPGTPQYLLNTKNYEGFNL
ncbi:MAG: hypothetical protein ABIV47_20755 [Roseiflexaceae bacterium]